MAVGLWSCVPHLCMKPPPTSIRKGNGSAENAMQESRQYAKLRRHMIVTSGEEGRVVFQRQVLMLKQNAAINMHENWKNSGGMGMLLTSANALNLEENLTEI
ncbi:unnamed protein product [Lupinus luteus]|uniref:Uncharacterized protein n=1 Tax=Lupinus luteus TaxID=3873 RepID=A0AAV1XE47_LUPLU